MIAIVTEQMLCYCIGNRLIHVDTDTLQGHLCRNCICVLFVNGPPWSNRPFADRAQRQSAWKLDTRLCGRKAPLFPDPHFHIGVDEINARSLA